MGRKTGVCALVFLLLAGASVYSWGGSHRSMEATMEDSDSMAAILLSVTDCPCTSSPPSTYEVKADAQDCWSCEDTLGDCHASHCATAEADCIECCDKLGACELACTATRGGCEACCTLP